MVILKGKAISKDELVTMNKIQSKPNRNRYHKLSQHNYYIKRYGRCMYCSLGSTPVTKVEFENYLKRMNIK